MRRKVTVIGAHETARALDEQDYADVVESADELAGSHVVVCTDAGPAAEIARRAPAAVVVVAGGPDACAEVLEATLFPRGKVIGAAGQGIDALVESIVLDRGTALECLARTSTDGGFVPTTACVGARGIERFV